MSIDEVVSAARSAVDELNDRGELPLSVRDRLHRLMWDDPQTRDAWPWLQILCAERAFPIWRDSYMDDRLPTELLDRARERMKGAEVTRARTVLSTAKTALDNRFLDGADHWPAVYAGFAALAAAKSALRSGAPRNAAPGSELDIPPDEWDACFLASLAIVGFASWERAGGESERAQFWRWYLTEAVPAAVHLGWRP